MTLFSTSAAIARLFPAMTVKAAKAEARALGYTIRRDPDTDSGYLVHPVGHGDSAMYAEDAAESLFLALVMAEDAKANRLSLAGRPTLRAVAAVLTARAVAAFNLKPGAIAATIEDNAATFDGGRRAYPAAPAGRLPLAEIAAAWACAAEAAAEDAAAIAQDGVTVEEAGPDWADSGLGRIYAQRGAGAFAFGATPRAAVAALARKEDAAAVEEAAESIFGDSIPVETVTEEPACPHCGAASRYMGGHYAPCGCRVPRSLSAAAVPVVFLDDSLPGCVMLYTESGAWVGPGLGDFASAQAARDWAAGRGYRVAPLMSPEEATATRAAAMRASLPALRASHASLDRRAASFGGLKAATLRARLRIVRDVARLKAGAIPGELAAAFALQVKPAPRPAMGRALAAVESLA